MPIIITGAGGGSVGTLTLQEIITSAKADGGIDATDEQVKVWALDRYRRLVAGARWRKLERVLGTTVDGQSRYSIGDDIVEIHSVRVGGSGGYQAISIDELWDLKAAQAIRLTSRGLFASGYDDDTEAPEFVELYPAPTVTGDSITALCAVLPPDLALDESPKVPVDFHSAIRDGVIADGLKLIDEQHAEADVYEQQFQAAVEMLRRRRNARVGSGPTRIRLTR